VPGDGCSATCTVECGFNCEGGTPTARDTCTSPCGDGELASDEACDDGNTVSGDGCAGCIKEPGYECHPPTTGCGPSTCTWITGNEICGDGFTLGAETRRPFFCDDGNTLPGDGCSATCTFECGYTCTGGTATTADACTSVCGDDNKTASEGCDDGNTVNGDGCSSTCTKEAGYSCTTPDCDRSTCNTVCGDGKRAGAEGCDDGASVPGDGCSATCTVECGFHCEGGTPVARDTCASPCGDGKKASGEACDDGNTANGDGCSSTCLIEPGWTPTLPDCDKSTFVLVCGDSIMAGNETCDDGNTVNGDGCSSSCSVECGFACGGAQPSVCAVTRCGDGVKASSEACDDGNTVNGDGCSSTCTKEDGWSCTTPDCATSTCNTVCGDGKRAGAEGCDDGASVPGDGCSATCTVECGFHCEGGTPIARDTCASPCGDGKKASDEACDDGNTVSGDGCAGCIKEPGYECHPSTAGCGPSTCTWITGNEICGDGFTLGAETSRPFFCDDGNTLPGDGCSATCTFECGYTCTGGTATTADACTSVCGDDNKTTSEGCDDGNTVNGDGCSSTCTKEDGYSCTTPDCDRSTCNTVCGDGRGLVRRDATMATPCRATGARQLAQSSAASHAPGAPRSLGTRATSPCGDGKKASDEACDDGNTVNGDGCSSPARGSRVQLHYARLRSINMQHSLRRRQEGWYGGMRRWRLRVSRRVLGNLHSRVRLLCTGGSPTAPDFVQSSCGDGELASDEECDDGNSFDDDGCSADCTRWKPGTTALRQPAIDPHAAQSAETGTGLVRRDATMATPSLATGARQTCTVERGYECHEDRACEILPVSHLSAQQILRGLKVSFRDSGLDQTGTDHEVMLSVSGAKTLTRYIPSSQFGCSNVSAGVQTDSAQCLNADCLFPSTATRECSYVPVRTDDFVPSLDEGTTFIVSVRVRRCAVSTCSATELVFSNRTATSVFVIGEPAAPTALVATMMTRKWTIEWSQNLHRFWNNPSQSLMLFRSAAEIVL
jgi:cysteine-rich repeat protein